MPDENRTCSNCQAETVDDAVCANCGNLHKASTALVWNAVSGVAGGIFLAATVFLVWGFINFLGIGSVAAATNVPSHCNSMQTEFMIYPNTGTGIYEVAEIVVTLVVAFFAIRWAIRIFKARRPGLAIAIIMAVFFGLVPATMCDVSSIARC